MDVTLLSLLYISHDVACSPLYCRFNLVDMGLVDVVSYRGGIHILGFYYCLVSDGTWVQPYRLQLKKAVTLFTFLLS